MSDIKVYRLLLCWVRDPAYGSGSAAGDFSGAVRENVFMIIALPVAVVYFLWEAVRYVQGKPALWRRKGFFAALGIVLAAAAVFTVLRNIPGSWLAPAWAVG